MLAHAAVPSSTGGARAGPVAPAQAQAPAPAPAQADGGGGAGGAAPATAQENAVGLVHLHRQGVQLLTPAAGAGSTFLGTLPPPRRWTARSS